MEMNLQLFGGRGGSSGGGGSGGGSRAAAAAPQSQRMTVQQALSDPANLATFFQNATTQEVDSLIDTVKNTQLDGQRRQNNSDTQRFFNALGWADRTPVALAEKEWQKAYAAAGNPQKYYHADNDYGAYTAKDFASQYFGASMDFNGTAYRHYLSGGIYGDGTYFATTAWASKGYGSNQFRGFLNSNAKIGDYNTLLNQMQAFAQSNPGFDKFINSIKTGYGSQGTPRAMSGAVSIFAAMQGYNVITNGRNYISVLDRSVTTVSTKQRSTRRLNSDW